MRIINLQAENIKRLVAIDITPEGNTIRISGKNGAGKTSVLDAIYWALGGTENIQDQPIREGQEEGHIRLDLGEYIVERHFKEGGKTALKISTADGKRFATPQTLLDSLLGAITFDPLAFSRMDAKKQADVIKKIANFEVDFDELEKLNKEDYDLRRDLNRDIKTLESQIAGIKVPVDTPEDLIDVSAKSNELNAALDKKREFESLERKISGGKAQLDDLQAQIKALEARIEEGGKIIKGWEDEAEKAKAELLEDKALEDLKSEIANASTVNQAVAQAKDKSAKKTSLKKLEDQVEEINKRMAERDKQKADAIAAAKLPVEGLSLNNGEVTFNNIPLEQCSSAEQLRISTAIAIAGNPKLRVIRIQDGALLDADSLALLDKMAADNDFQIWIERVGEEPLSVVIEEGRVKKAGK